VLAYSTYLGGSGSDEGNDIAVDSAGNMYVAGSAGSANFPTTPGAFQTREAGGGFVTKLNATGSARIYSTYLSGGAIASMALDSAGNAYVTGFTQSSSLPTTPGAISNTLNGIQDGFVTKLNPTGSALIYSTYLGGSSFDAGDGIAVDSAGNAYITGHTSSSNFPTANAFDDSLGGSVDVFVTKLNTAGTALVYSTYLGGDGEDTSSGSTWTDVAVDSAGNAYVTGLTKSTNFPTANAIDDSLGGAADAFVTKFNAAGSALVYSTYLGGINGDGGRGIAVDSAGNAYVTGATTSSDFPRVNALYRQLINGQDAFVTKFNAAGSALAYSTYLGGDLGGDNAQELGNDIAVDAAGNAYITGDTGATNFPTANPIQPTKAGGALVTDGFVTKLDAAGPVIAFSTYLGGDGSDSGNAIAADASGNIYVTGRTNSLNFPTANAIQPAKDGSNSDAFVSKIGSFVITGRVVDSGGAGLAGVTVTLSGASSATTTTDAGGNFLFLKTVAFVNYTVTPFKSGFTFSPETLQNVYLGSNYDLLFIGTPTSPGPTPTPATTQFNQTSYTASEGTGFVNVTLTRTGDTTGEASVKYQTSDAAGSQNCTTFNGKASERCDYTTSVGTVIFAAGEASKTFTIPLIDDAWVEGDETFTITLTNAVDLTLGTPVSATVVITDNDASAPTSNPIDGVNFFVRQQYLDILNRLPDTIGFQNWVNTLTPCPNGGFGEPPTSNCDRLYVAAGFFQSDEFLKRGYFAFRFYMVSFNQRPTYRQFIPDMAQVGGPKSPAEEETAKVEFANAFVQRPEFLAKYPGLTGQPLADALLQTAGLPAGSYVAGVQTNGQILRGIAEGSAAFNKFLTEGTVSILYFGFQRRDPDTIGYQNNVNTLNADPNNLRHMIFIFIYSTEYRQRFGPP
jgi:Calx-beta domain/Beta-propeller repeat/Carboxypeptidase regulatory-like domain